LSERICGTSFNVRAILPAKERGESMSTSDIPAFALGNAKASHGQYSSELGEAAVDHQLGAQHVSRRVACQK